jgi:hypothetical protein
MTLVGVGWIGRRRRRKKQLPGYQRRILPPSALFSLDCKITL